MEEVVIGTGKGVCDLVGYQIMVAARAPGDTARSKELQGRVQLPEYEAATATGAVTIIGDPTDRGLDIQRHTDRRQC
jgi:hypothetical protein